MEFPRYIRHVCFLATVITPNCYKFNHYNTFAQICIKGSDKRLKWNEIFLGVLSISCDRTGAFYFMYWGIS